MPNTHRVRFSYRLHAVHEAAAAAASSSAARAAWSSAPRVQAVRPLLVFVIAGRFHATSRFSRSSRPAGVRRDPVRSRSPRVLA